MPELPEVESTRRGLEPHLPGEVVRRVTVRERRLRWPISRRFDRELTGATIVAVERRAKYLLITTDRGTVILHLGMSGTLKWVGADEPLVDHDHVDIVFDRGVLRYRDPRRFGSIHWTTADPSRHKLLASLGPEPLGGEFDGAHLRERSRGRKIALRDFLLDGKVVVGVGNIYASEAAFRAGIRPTRAAGAIALARYERLADAIRDVLSEAIRAGGTTLRDYRGSGGDPGEFQLALRVYGREGEPCVTCGNPIRREARGQRSLYYCPSCQR